MPCNWSWPSTRRMDSKSPIPKPRGRFCKASTPSRTPSSNIRRPRPANRKPVAPPHLVHFVRVKIGFDDRTVGGGKDDQANVHVFIRIIQLGRPQLHLPHRTQIACLLYTSPSPRDGLLSRMPSSA